MGVIEVSPAELRDVKANLQEVVAGIETDLTVLQKEMATLQQGWSGAAQSAFSQQYGQVQKRLGRSVDHLASIVLLLQECIDSYGEVDRASSQMLGGQ